MTNFDEAVKLIAEEYREECEEKDCTIKELFKSWWTNAEEMKDEFNFILEDKKSCIFIDDDNEILDETGEFHTLKELYNAVKNYKF